MFLTTETFSVPANLIESDDLRDKQANFRAKVSKSQTVPFFPDDGGKTLACWVITAIHNLRDENPPQLIEVDRQLVFTEEVQSSGSDVFYCSPVFDAAIPLRRSGITEVLPDLVLQFRGDP